MRVSNHRLLQDDGAPIPFQKSPNQSSTIEPEFLVMHYTAGRSAGSSINWLTDPNAKASAHLVISDDGEITQLVAFNRKAWHAGVSRWEGRSGVNNFSIGIEFDNPGILKRQGGRWTNAWGDEIDQSRVVEAEHKNGGPVRGWYAYNATQLESAREVAACLVRHYGLRSVIGHDDVSPDRKVDPGPAFPMNLFSGIAQGRAEDAPEIYTTTDALNIRNGPGVDNDRLDFAPLPKGTRLEIIAEQGVWRQVDVVDEIQSETHRNGWVHSHYIARDGAVNNTGDDAKGS